MINMVKMQTLLLFSWEFTLHPLIHTSAILKKRQYLWLKPIKCGVLRSAFFFSTSCADFPEAKVWIKGCNTQFALTHPCCPPTEADRHRLCTSNQEKNWRLTVFLSGYVFAFVIGVAVGFVFSNIILFGSRLDQIPWADWQVQGCSLYLSCAKLCSG
jgi:hypothetical protein